MKKWLLIMASVLMLSSCGGNKNEQSENAQMGDRGYNEQSFNTQSGTTDKKTVISEEEADFGNFKWGMTPEDVTNVHGGGYSAVDDNTIRYNRIRIEGFASDAEYTFTDKKLSQAIYFIKPDSVYENKKHYIEDYQNLTKKYTERFGEPAIVEKDFGGGAETDDIAECAKLLDEGKLLYRTVWKTDTTQINVNLGNKDGDIVIGVRNIPIEQAEN